MARKNESDQIRKLLNEMTLTGKIAELTVRRGTDKNNILYISVKGVVQFSTDKAASRRFECWEPEYRINKETKEQKKNTGYDRVEQFLKHAEANTIAKVGYDNAYVCSLVCNVEPNDYVNSQNELKEGLRLVSRFYNTPGEKGSPIEYGTTSQTEGYLQSVVAEVSGENREETGRLRATVLSTNYFGDLVIFKNVVVKADDAETVLDSYEVGCTAKFFLEYEFTRVQEAPKTGGFGKRRSDDHVITELVMAGADPACDEDSDKAISKTAIKIAMNERQACLNELKEKGYQGNQSQSSTHGNTSTVTKSAVIADDDIPF